MLVALGPEEYTGFVNFGLGYENLFNEIDDGECLAIYAPKILDYIHAPHLHSFVEQLVKKMRRGCTITIGGTDLRETCKQILRGDYNIVTANGVIFGNDRNKVSQYSLDTITELLQQFNLKIESKILDGNEMCVKAVRK